MRLIDAKRHPRNDTEGVIPAQAGIRRWSPIKAFGDDDA